MEDQTIFRPLVITGRIHRMDDPQEFKVKATGKTFRRRKIYVDPESQYSKALPIVFSNDNVPQLDHYRVGDMVQVTAWLGGQEFKKEDEDVDTYFLRLSGKEIVLKRGRDPKPEETSWSKQQDKEDALLEEDYPF